jgi:TPR repeat protein
MTIQETENCASLAIQEGDYEVALGILLPLVNNNSEFTLLSLGWLYETGTAGIIDVSAALFYYDRAVSVGSAEGCFELGRLLLTQDDESNARVSFEIGAERGDISSMSRLGRMMVAGRGGPVDLHEGMKWLKNAAAKGHILAQRAIFDFELKNSKSTFEKFRIKMKIASLAKKGAKEILKNQDSYKIR